MMKEEVLASTSSIIASAQHTSVQNAISNAHP
jgi:hypothetical protein